MPTIGYRQSLALRLRFGFWDLFFIFLLASTFGVGFAGARGSILLLIFGIGRRASAIPVVIYLGYSSSPSF